MAASFRILASTLAVMIATTSGPASSVMAQQSRVSPLDGQPTAVLCANLGFKAAPDQQESQRLYMGSSGSGRTLSQAAPRVAMPAPPPPPPPPPPPRPAAPYVAQPVPMEMRIAPAIVAPVASDATFPGSETYSSRTPNGIKQTAAEPVSTFSIDVDTASYSNVRRFLRDGVSPPTDAVRVEELVNYFDYGYPAPSGRDDPFKSYLAVAPSPWAKGKDLIHIGVQGFKPPAGQEPPLNLVFLVDTSGSMSGPDRLPLAQKTLNVLIDQLRPQDTVSMVAYAGSAGAVLSPTKGREKLKMRCAVDALQSGGSTAGGAGLQLAYALAQQNFDKAAVNRVILMTDGDFNVGVTDNKRLEDFVAEKRKTGVYLSIYGFGRGNYQDERMQVLAQNGNGTAAYVDTLDEGRKLMRDDFQGSMFPIADDVKIQVEFNPAVVTEYRLIGYETRMLRREDFNNDRVDAGEVGAGVAVTALYEVSRAGGPASVDPLRYGAETQRRADPKSTELGYLKIRYKAPGGTTSKLIETPIGAAALYPSIDRAPEATRWAASVAAYGQKLRGDAYVGDGMSWDETLALAQGARGADPYGLRAEFIGLVRAAKEVRQRNAGL